MERHLEGAVGWFCANRDSIRRVFGGRVEVKESGIFIYGCVGQLVKFTPSMRLSDPCICGSGRKFRKCCEMKPEVQEVLG